MIVHRFLVVRYNEYKNNKVMCVHSIAEDTLKEKLEDKSKGNFVVTIETLEDIMEESIRIFWEFVKADTPGFLKVLMGAHAELEDPTDSKLMEEIQINLDKVTGKI